jgi:murein DD-endopeptidase MepM/ murein hydrolase activator NlpD
LFSTLLVVAAFLTLAICRVRYLARPLFLRTFYVMLAVDVAGIAAQSFFPQASGSLRVAILGGVWLPLLFALLRERRNERAWTRDANRAPLELAPPFYGTWHVAAGGPWRARNHHQIASDQRFAYDFIRTDEDSFGSTILAPIAGRVVSMNNDAADHPESGRVIEDPHPFGNYVAIATERATVFLVHLRCGSVRVRVGDEIEEGTPIGECGNSGRTSGPHLHIHGQDQSEPAPFEATGVPIAFRRAGVTAIAAYGDVLEGDEKTLGLAR